MTGRITRYIAYVAVDMTDYFDKKLHELDHEDKIYLVTRGPEAMSSNGTVYRPYVIECQEGTIHSDYEWPFEEKGDI